MREKRISNFLQFIFSTRDIIQGKDNKISLSPGLATSWHSGDMSLQLLRLISAAPLSSLAFSVAFLLQPLMPAVPRYHNAGAFPPHNLRRTSRKTALTFTVEPFLKDASDGPGVRIVAGFSVGIIIWSCSNHGGVVRHL